eukprot:459261_1
MNTKTTTLKWNHSTHSEAKSDTWVDEVLLFGKHGYNKVTKLRDTLQGELFKANQICSNRYVVIKKTNKSLFKERVAVEDGMRLCVSENIIKEALILQHLTMNNHCIGDCIIQFIDYFESDTSHYLVLEYIESETNLKQFVSLAHRYISDGLLTLKEYKKAIKYLCWQLAVTMDWLHNSMHCCHLDICCDNIMLQNCSFKKLRNGSLAINPRISIKIVDFGVAEMFIPQPHGSTFTCYKQGLSLENEAYLAPNVFANEVYNASCADMWSLGVVLFECLTGQRLYSARDIGDYLSMKYNCTTYTIKHAINTDNGYRALHQNTLRQYITTNRNYAMYLSIMPIGLLTGLLDSTERKRLNASSVLKHAWFVRYFEANRNQIESKAIAQKEKQLEQEAKMTMFPFYRLHGP